VMEVEELSYSAVDSGSVDSDVGFHNNLLDDDIGASRPVKRSKEGNYT